MSSDREAVAGEPVCTQRIRRCGRGPRVKRSLLAAAVASLLPMYGVAAQAVPAQAVPPAVQAGPDAADASQEEAGVTELETVQVTGTRVKGGSVPSPVISLDAGRIEEEGFHDLGEVIRSIPQNFTGGQNPGGTVGNLGGSGIANQNITGGSSLNLRGLGQDATLTLLNGRRLAYGGVAQGVDISAIPVEAVERIEILADGASAIYGSDAVAGVGNVILKREFEGVSVGARYGAAAEGGLATRQYTATSGAVWESGGLIATYMRASVDPIRAADRDYASRLTYPTTLHPGRDVDSALLSLHQAVGSRVELRLDALGTRRDQMYNFFLAGMNTHVTPRTTTTFVAPGIDMHLDNDWSISVSAAWGRDRHRQYQVRQDMGTWATVSQLDECYCNKSEVYEVGAEGPLFSLRAGEARVALGGGYRVNEFGQINNATGSPITEGRESSRFAYAELDVPLVSADSGIGGIERLDLTAAVRTEDYDTFGSVTTPKLGLIYSPSGDVTFKASAGRSFKAPTLFDRNYATFVDLDPPEYYGGAGFPADAAVMYYGGGNQDLEAERAKTWTASVALHPRALPGLEAELTWFDIDFTNRIKDPISSASQAMSNPAYAQFIIDAPSAELQQQLIDAADRFGNYTGMPYDPARVVALILGRRINASRQTARGLDLSGAYRVSVGEGSLTLRGGISWLESTEQTAAGQEFIQLAGTVFNPPELSARLGTVWNRDRFTVSTFANYSGGVVDTVNPGSRKGGSFTTLDATLRYSIEGSGTAGSGLQFELSAQNLFNRAPPLFTPELADYAPPYDATNYSAIGRFLGVSVTKHFR